MSSVPPNTPPGGGAPPPYPPYDPRTQWRVYREQQKAAWRAQRDAMRAQRYAWKAGYYGGVYTPRVPSVVGPIILIGVGIVAFLVVTGHIAAFQFWTWYAHWWPLLLIGAGLALLGEWALDVRRKVPVRRGGSFVGILILLAIIGFGAAGWNNWWGPFRAQFGDHGDDFFNAFGLPERDNDQQLLNAQIPANAAVEVQNPRGDVSITAGDGPNIQVTAHEVAFASSDADAKKIFDAEAAHLTVSGSAVLVKSQSNSSGRLNLTVTVPKSARVTVDAGRGDVTVAGLGAGINLSAAHGDVHLSSIAGSVQVHFPNGRHDFSAHQVDGDLTIDGDINDLTLSEIKGKITQSGDILGDVHIENTSGPVHLHTSVTDLQVAELPGDLTLNSDDLRVTEAKGQVRVTTHAKDVDLSQIYGDTYIEDRDGRIAVEPAGNFGVEAKNSKGDVELTLPPSASATVNARTHNGDIVSDFPMPSMEGENKSATFQIGSGGSRIVLSTDNGDLRIKKGSAFPATPPPPAATAATPATPAAKAPARNAPHLKAPKAAPSQPVTQ
ncbi:MAG TPA: DUF4097 family beta strand repeat-containing protein [Terracidiphilus sp.]|jgi:DUF4097 and DUF4098 domain-containing protein YvlB